MRPKRHIRLVKKAVDAVLSAIEIYNKPDFAHREEIFAILMASAWELMLKARILKENGDAPRSIEIWRRRTGQDGKKTKKRFAEKNRSGNVKTITLQKAVQLVLQYEVDGISTACADNIYLLMEIRDNAIHYVNKTYGFAEKVREIGAASLRNFAHAVEQWFNIDLDRYNFYLMPLAFQRPPDVIEPMLRRQLNAPTRRLFAYLTSVAAEHPPDSGDPFAVAMRIEMKFERTSSADAMPVNVTDDPDALKVNIAEEVFLQRFPWDFWELVRRMKARYSDFVQNNTFYGHKGRIEKNRNYCMTRLLDPNKPKGIGKRYYSLNVFNEFDKVYKVRKRKRK